MLFINSELLTQAFFRLWGTLDIFKFEKVGSGSSQLFEFIISNARDVFGWLRC